MTKRLPLISLPPWSTFHRLGSPSPEKAKAVLKLGPRGWVIPQSHTDESSQGWAIIGDSEGRRLAVETLLGRHRIHPPPPSPGAYPFITQLLASSSSTSTSASSSSTQTASADLPVPIRPIRHLAFSKPPPSGEFSDFTARYGALQEEDKLTFLQTLLNLSPSPSFSEIERVCGIMKISHLLDLPSVSFSSGQLRRGRIATALLTRPVLLLLEDPMAGLDVSSRKEVSDILGELNKNEGIRVVLVLRGKGLKKQDNRKRKEIGKGKGKEKEMGGDGLPEWITHVADVRNGEIWIGSKDEWEEMHFRDETSMEGTAKLEEWNNSDRRWEVAKEDMVSRKALLELNGVNVSYGEGTRPVLKDINWVVKEGERWHLQGSNGSGKTTLLSIILGHHPRSFSLPASGLQLFSKPRKSIPTPTLRTLIGHTSPEVFAAFPRGMGLNALEVVGSGFEGVYSRRNLNPGQKERVLDLLSFFQDDLKSFRGSPFRSEENGNGQETGSQGGQEVLEVARTLFARFTPPQQAILLFLRALVNRPKVLILDEPSQGVDEAIWEKCKLLLKKENKERPEMAVIVVSHYEDEVPWGPSEGRIIRLKNGVAEID